MYVLYVSSIILLRKALAILELEPLSFRPIQFLVTNTRANYFPSVYIIPRRLLQLLLLQLHFLPLMLVYILSFIVNLLSPNSPARLPRHRHHLPKRQTCSTSIDSAMLEQSRHSLKFIVLSKQPYQNIKSKLSH